MREYAVIEMKRYHPDIPAVGNTYCLRYPDFPADIAIVGHVAAARHDNVTLVVLSSVGVVTAINPGFCLLDFEGVET